MKSTSLFFACLLSIGPSVGWTQYDDEPEEKPWTDEAISKTQNEISRLEKELAQETSPDLTHAKQLDLRLEKARKRDLEELKTAFQISKSVKTPADRRGRTTVIVRSNGKAEAGTDGRWQDVAAGFPIKTGESLRTGADGFAVVWYDGGFVYLDKSTSMDFPEKTCLSLKSGFCHWDTIRKHAPQKDKCDLSTPDTTVNALGTEFDIGYDSSRGKTRYSPYSGAVQLRSGRPPALLPVVKMGAMPDNAAARVAEMKGAVSIQKGGSRSWTPAKAGALLSVSDKIKTGPAGYAELELPCGYRLALRSNSMFEPQPAKDGAPVLALWEGLARLWKVAAGGVSPQIRTPSAVAAVRGTDFEIEVSNFNQLSTIYPKEGDIEVTGLKDNLTLHHRSIWWDPQ